MPWRQNALVVSSWHRALMDTADTDPAVNVDLDWLYWRQVGFNNVAYEAAASSWKTMGFELTFEVVANSPKGIPLLRRDDDRPERQQLRELENPRAQSVELHPRTRSAGGECRGGASRSRPPLDELERR